jgi:hypothetical protein
LTSIERDSRYWLTAQVGMKDKKLFELGMNKTWQWAREAELIRLWSDGENRYGQQLWQLAAVWLKREKWPKDYPYRKVWREGVEVAMKIKGSQGRPRRKWVHQEHPFTAISSFGEVHANHNEAQNSAIRRRCSAYRRRQNHYAKTRSGLQRAITVQRLIHNWIRPHISLGKGTTPAMAMNLASRPITLYEFLTSRGFQHLTT